MKLAGETGIDRVAAADPEASRGRRLPFSPWHLVLAPAALLFALPLLWMVLSSFMSNAQINQFPPTIIPDSLHVVGWDHVLTQATFPRWFMNSTIVAVVTVISNLIFCSLAGYAFARLRFRGSTALFLLILATLVIPFQLTMIPTFIVMEKLNLTDTLGALIVPGLALPLGVFLMRQFFINLPSEVEEAARIDGCSRLGAPPRRPAAGAAGVGDARGAHLPADVERPVVALDRDQLRRQLHPAARIDHLPGSAHDRLGRGDGWQRDHRDAGADRLPVRTENVHSIAHLERRQGIGER